MRSSPLPGNNVKHQTPTVPGSDQSPSPEQEPPQNYISQNEIPGSQVSVQYGISSDKTV